MERLEDALNLLEAGNAPQATEVLARLVARTPAHVTVHVLLAQAYERQHRWQEALAVWQMAHLLLPDTPLVQQGSLRAARVLAALRTMTGPAAPLQPPPLAPLPTAPDHADTSSGAAEAEAPAEAGASVEAEAPAEDILDAEMPETGAATPDDAEAMPDDTEEVVLEHYDDAPETWEAETSAPSDAPTADVPLHEAVDDDVAQDDDATWDDGVVWETVPPSPGFDPAPEADTPEDEGATPENDEAAPPPAATEPPEEDDTQTPLFITDDLDLPSDLALPSPETAAPAWDPAPYAPSAPEIIVPDAEAAQEPVRGPYEPFDLDDLIASLSGAGRIVPRDVPEAPPPEPDESDLNEMVSPTLARIHAAQGQYAEAARIYDRLAVQEPQRAAEYHAEAEAMRAKAKA